MTAHKMKDNLFIEKIGGFKIRRTGNDRVISPVISIEKFPITFSYNAQIELFNVKVDHEYIIMINYLEKDHSSN
ncbi:hypothetical protein [Streptococcus agalactiae]|nr:hypothetical protein [Streptococcus agalactiae]